ncbi:DUF7507 domain-containing protein [Parafrankia sp. FMc2]|uniref:DUF7507 domain-containing protein n=1 Tax=Parafrankia sp. FMc2 TaxID=3233196 RepID=UPI003B588F2F
MPGPYVSLTDVSLVDSTLGPVSHPSTVIAPGRVLECTSRCTTTQDDVLNESVTNSVFVTARATDGFSGPGFARLGESRS